MENFILKGNLAYSEDKNTIKTITNGYLVCVDGRCEGAFVELPELYRHMHVIDHHNDLIIPGMTDLHAHAPQYTFRGTGMDYELLDWLNNYTFPEEAHYKDCDYAKKAYDYFAYDLLRCFTTRAVLFATLHNDATTILMDALEKTGVITYVGRVNMDRNGNEMLQEESAEASIAGTLRWLDSINGRYKNTMPIITPRFIPSCSDGLMKSLGDLARKRGLRIQSHLSENLDEIAWVKELVPVSTCYANAYEIFDCLGDPDRPAIMAHCVYSDDLEEEILKNHGTFIAHCADSNMNLSSGIAPVKKFLNDGLNVGLGTDVSAGSSMNMLKTILTTIQCSKMYYRLIDHSTKPLTFEEAFYLATMGGGKFFGDVGSFMPGYEFDAVVINDSKMFSLRQMSIRERVERICYNDADATIMHKYVRGKEIFSRD